MLEMNIPPLNNASIALEHAGYLVVFIYTERTVKKECLFT
jgi:hypothetical protein